MPLRLAICRRRFSLSFDMYAAAHFLMDFMHHEPHAADNIMPNMRDDILGDADATLEVMLLLFEYYA